MIKTETIKNKLFILKFRHMYWLLGTELPVCIHSKLLICKNTIKPRLVFSVEHNVQTDIEYETIGEI